MSKAAEIGHSPEKFGVFGDHHPTLYGMKKLGGVKAAGRNISVFEDRFASYFHPKGMCSVVDNFESVPVSDFADFLDLAGNPIDMGSQDGGSLRSDGSFDQIGIDGVFIGQDIYIDRFATFPDDAGGSCHVRKRSGYDFTFQIESFDGKLESDSPVSDKEQVIEIQVFLELQFQFVDQRAIIG